MGLAHKTLTISEEAYSALSSLKAEDESFTDAILRLSKARSARPLSSFAGKWHGSTEETKEIFGRIDRMWGEYRSDLGRKLNRAFEPARIKGGVKETRSRA